MRCGRTDLGSRRHARQSGSSQNAPTRTRCIPAVRARIDGRLAIARHNEQLAAGVLSGSLRCVRKSCGVGGFSARMEHGVMMLGFDEDFGGGRDEIERSRAERDRIARGRDPCRDSRRCATPRRVLGLAATPQAVGRVIQRLGCRPLRASRRRRLAVNVWPSRRHSDRWQSARLRRAGPDCRVSGYVRWEFGATEAPEPRMYRAHQSGAGALTGHRST